MARGREGKVMVLEERNEKRTRRTVQRAAEGGGTISEN
jgi:hypothetical protein